MKKLIAIVMVVLAVIMISCQKKIDMGAVSLGSSYAEVVEDLTKEDAQFEEKTDSIVRAYGEIYILDTEFKNIVCEFENDRLQKISVWRKFSSLSDPAIQHFKKQMRELCGDGYSDTEEMVAGYGIENDNNGCIGGIKVVWNDNEDVFFATIRLAD